MKGIISVTVENNRVRYTFDLRRNITILKGDSATGKTTLIDMIASYEQDPKNGITLQCDKACRVLAGVHWKEQLKPIKNSIVFIDEGNAFIREKAFADMVRKSDNYYVLATREKLPMLSYSVEEIYGIANKTKGYGRIRRLYSGFFSLYPIQSPGDVYDQVIVEDSNAGYTYFRDVFQTSGIPCISAKGKSKIAEEIMKTPPQSRILVIADGAAFGSEIETVMRSAFGRQVELYLPESFEWLILRSGLVKDGDIRNILEQPPDYIESREYLSWERFFTRLLTDRTKGTYLEYSKRKLNPAYLQSREKASILDATPLRGIQKSQKSQK